MADANQAFEALIRKKQTRPPVPGEVWNFDAPEAHVFYDIFKALHKTGIIGEKNPILKTYLDAFKAVNKIYELYQSDLDSLLEMQIVPVEEKSDLEFPSGVQITPTEEDRGFFAGLVPFFSIFVSSEHPEANKTKCKCKDFGCERENEFSCGHSAQAHLTIVLGWYEREITGTEKFAESRRAILSVPASERYIGLPIIARSDMERIVREQVKKELDAGAYSEKGTEEMVLNFFTANPTWSIKECEEATKKFRECLARQMFEDIVAQNEQEYRVIDL